MNRKSLNPLHPLEINEAIEGHTRSASRKAQNLGPLFTIERLESSPPPYNDGIRACVSVVFRCSSPLINVNVRRPRNEQLEFLFIELKLN